MGKSRIVDIATAGLELPPDLLSGAARITLLGRELLKVVNHRCIVIYEPEQIILRISEGRLLIYGKKLAMSELNDEQMIVEGYVDSIAFEEENDED